MIALMILGSIVIYVLVLLPSLWIVSRFTKSKKAKWIILVIWLLIPTWDYLLGNYLHWYFCKYKTSIQVYKTFNIDGFYIGECTKQYEPYEPYNGYGFVDYREKESNKYYRSYWIDDNASKLCVPVKLVTSPYAETFAKGKCIVKEEIADNNVSLPLKIEKKVEHHSFLYLNIDRVEFLVSDQRTNEKYLRIVDYFVDESWYTAINFVSGEKHRMNCNRFVFEASDGMSISGEDLMNELNKGRTNGYN